MQGGEATSKPGKDPDFWVDIALASHDDGTVLTPLQAPDHDGTTTVECVPFEITVTIDDDQTKKLDSLEIEILAGGKSLYLETAKDPLLAEGTHKWCWDGYDTIDVLDTKVLKSELEVKIRGTALGKTKEETTTIEGAPAHVDWVDVVVTRGATAAVELRVNFEDGGAKGVGRPAPNAVKKHGLATPANLAPHVRTHTYADLKGLALAGIDAYWSRSVTAPKGAHLVEVKSKETGTESMDDVWLVYNTNGSYLGSSNPGSVTSFLSFFAQVAPERISYNTGWIEDSGRWDLVAPARADANFLQTSAHEIGHEILKEYGGTNYSFGHKGSTNPVTQDRFWPKVGGATLPAAGEEVDLMKYYKGTPTRKYMIAAEHDVLGLIWLTAVRFSG